MYLRSGTATGSSGSFRILSKSPWRLILTTDISKITVWHLVGGSSSFHYQAQSHRLLWGARHNRSVGILTTIKRWHTGKRQFMQGAQENRIILAKPGTNRLLIELIRMLKNDKTTKIFNNLIYQYIDIYQQLEFHRNVSETILAYSTDIPCKYSFANVKTQSLSPPPLTHWHRHEKSKQNVTLLEKIHKHKQGTNKLNCNPLFQHGAKPIK